MNKDAKNDNGARTDSDAFQAHRRTAQEALERHDVDPEQGLDARTAADRLAEVGPNRLRELKKSPCGAFWPTSSPVR